MVYVTGDMHGEWGRFKAKELRNFGAADTLIVCGDFGFIWDGSRRERSVLRKMAALPYTVAFVDGCHENFELLEQYPKMKWKGGSVHKIAGNIIHLCRGQIFTIEEHTYFTFGGGHSQDYDYRADTEHWWRQERPTQQEIAAAIHRLSLQGNDIDYVITHEPPASLKDCLGIDTRERLEVHAFFDDMIQACTYRKWFFGKCHLNKYIPAKFYAVFDKILPVTVKNTDIR